MKRHAHTPRPVSMFAATAQDLPLFSLTPMRAQESVYRPTPATRAPSLFGCGICYGTGRYNGKKCPCTLK
jgi:hypothetical protein